MFICNKFLAPNGEPSLLYAGLSQKYGEEKATELWHWAKSDAIDPAELDVNGEPTITAVENKLVGESLEDKIQQLPIKDEVKILLDLIKGNPIVYTADGDIVHPYTKDKLLGKNKINDLEQVVFANLAYAEKGNWDHKEVLFNILKEIFPDRTDNTIKKLANYAYALEESKFDAQEDSYLEAEENNFKSEIKDWKENFSLGNLKNYLEKAPFKNVIYIDPLKLNSANQQQIEINTQKEVNPLQINPELLAKDNDAKLVPIRDAAGNHTGKWFDYASRQVPTIGTLTFLFTQNYNQLTNNQDWQKAMTQSPIEFIKNRVLDTFKNTLDAMIKVLNNPTTYTENQVAIAKKVVDIYQPIVNSFSSADGNGFWEYAMRQLELNGIKFNQDGTINEHESNLKALDNDIESIHDDETGNEDNPDRVQQDWQIDSDSVDMLNKAGVKLRGLFMGIPDCEFKMTKAPGAINIPIASQVARNLLAKGAKTDIHISAEVAQSLGVKMGVPFSTILTSNNNTTLIITPTTVVDAKILANRASDVKQTEGADLKIGDIQAKVEIFKSEQYTAPKANFLKFAQSADQKDLWTKVQRVLVDLPPSADAMIDALKTINDPNIQYLVNTLEHREFKNSKWTDGTNTRIIKGEIFKGLVKVMSAQTKRQLLVSYIKGKDGHLTFRVIDANQSSEIKSIVKFWQEQQKSAEILNKNEDGQFSIDKNLALGLQKELQNIYSSNASTEDKKIFFKDVLEINGINVDSRTIDDLMDQKKFDGLRKRLNIQQGLTAVYGGTTANGEALGVIDALVGRMANSIVNSQQLEDTTEYDDNHETWMDNNPLYTEGNVMKILATAEAPYSTVKFSTTHKNANGDSVQSTGMNTQISHTMRMLKNNENGIRSWIKGDYFRKGSWVFKQLQADPNRWNGVNVVYVDAIKNYYGSSTTRTDMSPREEWALRLGLYSHGKDGGTDGTKESTASYLSLTHSDKTTSPIFYNFPKLAANQTIQWDGQQFKVNSAAIDIIYNSVFLAEYERMTKASAPELNNYEVGKGLFYTIPLLNKEVLKDEIGKSITQQEYNIIWNPLGTINPHKTTMGGVSFESTVKKVINTFMQRRIDDVLAKWDTIGLTEAGVLGSKSATDKLLSNVGFSLNQSIGNNGKYYTEIINPNGEKLGKNETEIKNRAIATDFMVNSFLVDVGIAQMILGDPAQCFKPGKGDLVETADEDGNLTKSIKESRQVAALNATMAEYSKRMAGPIAPGMDSDNSHAGSPYYVSICTADYKPLIKELQQAGLQWSANATDAQQFATVQHWLNEAYGQELITEAQYTKGMEIVNNSKGGFYTFKDVPGLEDKIYHMQMNPGKPVLYGMNEPTAGGVSRTDYGKTSSFYLYPPMITGWEADKLRKAMERDGVDTIDFESNRKIGAPSNKIQLFTADGRIDESVFKSDAWKVESRQNLLRNNVRYQQEIHPHEDTQEQKMSTQAHTNILDGLPNMPENVKFDMGDGVPRTGKEVRRYMEDTTVSLLNHNHSKYLKDIGAKLDEDGNPVWEDRKKLYTDLAKYTLQQAGFQSDDYTSLVDFVEGSDELKVPLWLNKSAVKLEAKMFAQLNKVKDIMLPGKPFVQVSPAGMQTGLDYWENGTYKESDIIWATKFEGELTTAQLITTEDGSKSVKPAQVLVSQDYFAATGLNLADYMHIVDGKQMLDMERFPKELLQLVGVRIPNQGFVSMLPIEIAGFLPAMVKSSIIVPAAITKQMGGDFDVDKLFTYRRGFKVDRNGITVHPTQQINDKVSFLRDWEGVEGTDEELASKELSTEQADAYNYYVKNNPTKENINSIKNRYFNVHWGVLTNPAIYDKMMAELDKDDLAQEKLKYGNGKKSVTDFFNPDTQNSIRQDLGDAKIAVGTSALMGTSNVKLQDKVISLESLQKTDVGLALIPASIIVKDNKGNEHNLAYINGYGEGTYTAADGTTAKRTKSDNGQIVMNAAVDNAKDRAYTDAGMNRHVSNAQNAIIRLQTMDTAAGPGWSAATDFEVGLLQQPIIKEFVSKMGTGNDGLNETFTPNIKDSIIAELRKKYTDLAMNGATAEQQEKLSEMIDSTLFSAKDLEELIKMQESRTKYAKQVAALNLFVQFDSVGKQIVTAQSATAHNTRGAGKDMISALTVQKKIDRFDSPSAKDPKILTGFANVWTNNDGSENELGAFKRTTQDTALKLFGDIFPISKMDNMFQTIHDLKNPDVPDPSERTKRQVKGAIENYLNSHEWLGLFSSAEEDRNRLMLGKDSLAKRLKKVQQTWAKEDPFLRPDRLIAEINLTGGPDTISYQAFGLTTVQEIEGQSSLISMLSSADEDKVALASDLIKYLYATGGKQNAKNYMKFLTHGIIAGSGIAEGQRLQTEHLSTLLDKKFVEQFLQHNPDKAPQLERDLPELGKPAKLANEFVLPIVPTEVHTNLYKREYRGNGEFVNNYHDYISYRDNSKPGKDKWRIFKKDTGTNEGTAVRFYEIDRLGNTSKQILEYSASSRGEVRSVFPENRVDRKDVQPKGKTIETSLSMQSVGLLVNKGTGKELMTSLSTIAADIEQPGYLRDIAEALANTRTGPTSDLFHSVLGLNTPLSFQVVDRIGDGKTIALFQSKSNQLSITQQIANSNKKVLAENIVHEMLHYNTDLLLVAYDNLEKEVAPGSDVAKLTDYLKANPDVIEKLKSFNNILEEARKRYANQEKKSDKLEYALSNSREFMSHIFTNPETMKWLNAQKYIGKKSLLDHIQDIIAKIWDSITKAFGANENSLLEESIKRGLNVVMTNRTTKWDYESSTTPDIHRVGDSIQSGNINTTLTPNEKVVGKLKENLIKLKLSMHGQLTSTQREERKGKIEELENHITKLENPSTPIDAITAVGEQWVRFIEKKANEPHLSENELATAQFLADTWKGIEELIGSEDGIDNDPILHDLTRRVQIANRLLATKRTAWVRATFNLGDNAFEDSLKDNNATETWLRPLATAVNELAVIGMAMKNNADQEDEAAKRELTNIESLEKDIENEYGHGSSKKILQSFQDPETKRLRLQFTQEWFNKIHKLRSTRNGFIYFAQKADGATEESIALAKVQAWDKFKKEVQKVGVYVDVNKLLITDPSSADLGKEHPSSAEYKTELGKQIGQENVEDATRIASEKYQKFLKHFEDFSSYIDTRLEPMVDGKTILSDEDRTKQDYLTVAEVEAEKLRFRNQYSPAVIVSESKKKSLIAAKDDYVHLVPLNTKSNQVMWDQEYKKIMSDDKLREFYDRFNTLKLMYQRMYPVDSYQSKIPGFLPVVHKSLTVNQSSVVNQLKEAITNFNENLTKKIAAGKTEQAMNSRAFDRIPTPFIDEDSVAMEDRSEDLAANLKLFAMAAVHYQHASAAKDMSNVVKSKLVDIQNKRIAGNVQDTAADGRIVTNSESMSNALKSIEHLEDVLIYLRPKKLEGNSGGKLYAKNEYRTNEAGERELVKRNFSNPLNPLTHIGLLGGAQAKASKEIESIMIDKTRLEDDFKDHKLGVTDTENTKAYEIGMQEIESRLSKYTEYSLYGSKIGDWMMEVQGKKALGFNPFSAFSNVSFGLISTYIHASAGTDFNTKEVNRAWGMMMKALRDKELAHKIHSVMDRLGVIGEFIDLKYGKSEELKAAGLKKLADPYYLMRESDFFMKGVSTLATLFHQTAETSDGKIPIWETLDRDAKWNTEKYGKNLDWYNPNTTIGVNKWNSLRQYVSRVNMILHGNQDKNSPMVHKGYILGRLLGQFRSSWLIEGFANRFQSERFDYALGREVKGRYRTFQSMGGSNSINVIFKSVFNSLLKKLPFGTIDPTKGVYIKVTGKDGRERRVPITESAVDMENLKRNLAEVNFYLVLSSIVLLLKGLKGDKDDDDTPILNAITNLAVNTAIRSRQDINLYASPGVFDQVFRDPIPAFSVVKDFSKMMKYTTTGWADYNYQDGFSIDKDFTFEKWLNKVAKGNVIIPEAALIPKIEYMLTKDLDKLQ